MLLSQRPKRRIFRQWHYIIKKILSRRVRARLTNYRAFPIGIDELAARVEELNVQDDVQALEEAAAFLNAELTRVEVWCGTRKVGDIRAKNSENGAVCHSL